MGDVSGVEPRTEAEKVALAFLGSMGPTWEEFVDGYDRWMTDDVVWQNAGHPDVHGKQRAIKMITNQHRFTGMDHCRITVHNIASNGNLVFTERTDWMCREDDSVICEFKILSVIEVRDGKVARYYDSFSDDEFLRLFPSFAAPSSKAATP